MNDEPEVRIRAQGLEDEFPDGPPTAVITYRGCRLILRFAEGDILGEGDVQELRLLPDTQTLELRVLRQFAPQAELYLAYARAAMRILEPKKTAEERREKWDRLRASAEALREISGPGRGLTDGFYRTIAEEHQALLDGGEPHPIKALGENHHVTISAASHWIKEARRRGHLPAAQRKVTA
jgi:hypothetical protein